MRSQLGSFVDGVWLGPVGDQIAKAGNPYTEEPFGVASICSAAEVDVAVRSADRALRNGEWPRTPLDERIAIARRVKAGLAARTEEIATLTTSSMGMLYRRALTLGRADELIDMYVDMAHRLSWSYARSSGDAGALISRRPVGVVAAIVPWNSPIRSAVKKVIPAIIAGCTVVLKPALETPFEAGVLGEVCRDAGLPPGVLNVVPGDATTGMALVSHRLVRAIVFTGSSAAGSKIWELAAPEFKRLQLELGGKSAAIVLDDVDMGETISHLARGIFTNAGQQCVATSRILAPKARYDEVVAGMVDAAQSLRTGDPFDPSTTLGPLVSERQRTRVLAYIEAGGSEGASIATGGRAPKNETHGWFVEPTVFANVDNAMQIAQEEIFGPVACVIPYDSVAEAVTIANGSDYGLAGAVYSADPMRALRVAQTIEAGVVAINGQALPASAPFGGLKRSGIGREHGIEGYDSFLEYVSYPMPRAMAEELSACPPTSRSS